MFRGLVLLGFRVLSVFIGFTAQFFFWGVGCLGCQGF